MIVTRHIGLFYKLSTFLDLNLTSFEQTGRNGCIAVGNQFFLTVLKQIYQKFHKEINLPIYQKVHKEINRIGNVNYNEFLISNIFSVKIMQNYFIILSLNS